MKTRQTPHYTAIAGEDLLFQENSFAQTQKKQLSLVYILRVFSRSPSTSREYGLHVKEAGTTLYTSRERILSRESSFAQKPKEAAGLSLHFCESSLDLLILVVNMAYI